MNLKDSLSFTCCLTFSILLLFLLLVCYPRTWCTLRNLIIFHSIKTPVSRVLFGLSFCGFVFRILFHSKVTLILRIFSIVLDWIATFVSFTLLGFSCFRLLYCYHGHVKFLFLSIARLVSRTPKAFLSIDYYLGILDTFRILFFSRMLR